MKNFILLALPVILLAGCAPVHKEMVATGGSKADGVVEVSYEYTETETPEVNKQQGLEEAIKRCKAWGYNNAEAFGGSKHFCTVSPGFWTSCRIWRVETSYQCLDK